MSKPSTVEELERAHYGAWFQLAHAYFRESSAEEFESICAFTDAVARVHLWYLAQDCAKR